MKHIDLFSGIGGFSLAFDTIYHEQENQHIFVEYDAFCQAVLKKHWPEAEYHGDIRAFVADAKSQRERELAVERKPDEKAAVSRGDRPFLLTGGFPCQPFSHAGRRKGTDDDRYLWPPMFEAIRTFRPKWVIAENVAGLASWNDGLVFETVCADLENEGYEVQPFIIPAAAIGAPHRRDRIWFVAHCASEGGEQFSEQQTEGQYARCNRKRSKKGSNWSENWPEVAARFCAMDDGVPAGLVRPRGWRNAALKAAGNAIVPQVAMEIMRAIKEVDNP